MWEKIKRFFSIKTLDNSAEVVGALEEVEQTLEAGQVIANILSVDNEEIEDILEVDDRLLFTALVFSIFSYLLKLVRYIRKPNKNATNTTGLIANSFIFAANMLLGLVWLGFLVLSPPLLIVAGLISLVADIFYNLIETMKYTYLTLTSKTRLEARLFAPKILYHIKGAAFAALFGAAASLLTFDFPISAGFTYAIMALTAAAAIIVGGVPLIKSIFSAGGRAFHFISKRFSKKPNREEPGVQITINEHHAPLVPRLINANFTPLGGEENKKINTDNVTHSYYKNTCILPRPIHEIEEDIHWHIQQLRYLTNYRASFIDRKQIEKRKEKISGLNMLLMFIEAINKAETTQKKLFFSYCEVTGAVDKNMTITIDRIDLTERSGREQCFAELQKKIQHQYPDIFNQFSLKTKHGRVQKLFTEIGEFFAQPDLNEIKDEIAKAKQEAKNWYAQSFIDKASPFSNHAFTLRTRTPPQAFQFLEEVVTAIETNQLDIFAKGLLPPGQKRSAHDNDPFFQVEEKLRTRFHADASFDVFSEGKLAILLNDIYQYYMRHRVDRRYVEAASVVMPSLS